MLGIQVGKFFAVGLARAGVDRAGTIAGLIFMSTFLCLFAGGLLHCVDFGGLVGRLDSFWFDLALLLLILFFLF